jgi:hypothetical protein
MEANGSRLVLKMQTKNSSHVQHLSDQIMGIKVAFQVKTKSAMFGLSDQ